MSKTIQPGSTSWSLRLLNGSIFIRINIWQTHIVAGVISSSSCRSPCLSCPLLRRVPWSGHHFHATCRYHGLKFPCRCRLCKRIWPQEVIKSKNEFSLNTPGGIIVHKALFLAFMGRLKSSELRVRWRNCVHHKERVKPTSYNWCKHACDC